MKKRKQLYAAIVLALATSIGTWAYAADFASANGMVEALSGVDINQSEFMQDSGLNVGGWLSFGFTYNSNDPGDNFNGPVTFNDRAEEFQVNQLYLFIERAVDTESNSWDIGGRADILYGTDAGFTQAAELDDELIDDRTSRFYKLAFPQFYAEVFAPVGNGITAKIGHFYTIIGNEVVTSPDNFFYSHAYTMQYAEPFTHTGVLFETPITNNFSLTAGAVLGWDNFGDDTDIWNFLGGINWTSDDEATSIAIAAVQGVVSEARPNDDRWVYSVVISHDITDRLHYLIQHDHGREEGAIAGSSRDAEWYGINQYLTYDISDTLTAGLRAEWFRDDDGTRVVAPIRAAVQTSGTNGVGTSYYAITAGLNVKAANWITVRPEVRYDWADGGDDPFDGGNKDHQFLIATDVVITF